MTTADSRWSTLSFAGMAALVCCGIFVSVGVFSMGAALPKLAESFAGAPNAALLVQVIGAVVSPVFAVASPVAGKLVSRFGVRTVYIGSGLLVALGGAGPALSSGLVEVVLLRVVLALGVAGAYTAGMSGVARLPEGRRPAVLGWNAFVAGAICLPLFPLVGALAETSWRWAFATHLVVLPLILLALALPGRDVAAVPAAAAGPVGASPAPAGSGAGLLAGVPPRLLFVTAIGGLALFSSSMYSPFFLASIGITEPSRIGQILGIMSLCSLAGSGSYGTVHRFFGTANLLRIGLGIAATACLMISLARGWPLAVAGMGLFGVGLSIFAASSYALAIESVGPTGNVPAAMGVMSFVLYGSQMAFPVLSGTLGQSVGPAAVFMLLATLLALGLALLSGKTRRVAISASG